MSEAANKISGSCHCGKVGFEILQEPKQLVDCNCSICRRIGGLWGHIRPGNFRLTAAGETIAYVQGDKTLATHSCKNCGCTTHWLPLDEELNRMAVNFRMCEPEDIARFRIRKFDGADTWTFPDED